MTTASGDAGGGQDGGINISSSNNNNSGGGGGGESTVDISDIVHGHANHAEDATGYVEEQMQKQQQKQSQQHHASMKRPSSLSISYLDASSFSTPPSTPPQNVCVQTGTVSATTLGDRDHDDGHSDRRRTYSRTILEEIQEVLPQSYMIFLIADLRLMSGTGRIRTRYETLAIDSDLVPRCTAKDVACMSPEVIGKSGKVSSSDSPHTEMNSNSVAEEMLRDNDDEGSSMLFPELKTDNQNHVMGTKTAKLSAAQPVPNIPPRSKISKHSSRELSMIERASEGLSPRQVMAILLLELRDTFLAAKKELEDKGALRLRGKKGSDQPGNLTEDFRNYRSSRKNRRDIEDSMESLLRAYARMISADLISEVASVKRRRETMARTASIMKLEGLSSPLSPGKDSGSVGSTSSNNNVFSPAASTASAHRPTIPVSIMASIKEEVGNFDDRSSDGEDDADADDNDTEKYHASEIYLPAARSDIRRPVATMRSGRQNDSEPLGDGGGLSSSAITSSETPNKSTSDYNRSRRDIFTEYNPLTEANRKQITEKLKERQERVKQAYNDGVDAVLPQNREANTQKEFEELTNIIFEQNDQEGGSNANASGFRSGEMTRILRKAVESRDDDRLSFLSRLFKDGSVSQLMADSHARVVWINDWYPLKDLTYAIAVDKKLRRVLVVFRGAITSTDWKMVSKYTLEKIRNPVKDDYEGKKARLRVFQGFYTYLFRRRMDTGTNKYDEIANLVHKYGTERIGEDYSVFVTGHSLGAGLSVFFSFFASTDERFTRNGPVKAIAFSGPYCGGHSFTDAFRHQERSGKLMFARVHNNNDPVPYMPFNFRIGGRGCLWRHIGVGVVLPPVPWFRRWKPKVTYFGKEQSWASSTLQAYRNNVLFHFPWRQAWNFAKMHTLFELQDRLMYGASQEKAGGDFRLLNMTFEELYQELEENNYKTLSKKTKATLKTSVVS